MKECDTWAYTFQYADIHCYSVQLILSDGEARGGAVKVMVQQVIDIPAESLEVHRVLGGAIHP